MYGVSIWEHRIALVGYWNGEKVELIDNVFGKKLTPSVVGIESFDCG